MTLPKTAAVISSPGIGDGVMMMVASHLLHHQGYVVTTFHNGLQQISDWFPSHRFLSLPKIPRLAAVFSSFDLVILQYDHHRLETKFLIKLYQEGLIKKLSIFYPSKESAQREQLSPYDQIFSPNQSMVENIAVSISSLLSIHQASKNNGLTPLSSLERNKYNNRIVINPIKYPQASAWSANKFIKVGEKLQKLGYTIAFCVPLHNRFQWEHILAKGFLLPALPSIREAISYIFESYLFIGNDSGLGHIASNLQMPTVIIANCYKRMRLWKPGWFPSRVLTPAKWILNPKKYRYRERYWDLFISTRQVINACKEFINIY